jgi:DNA-3-methyladenine glycosylase
MFGPPGIAYVYLVYGMYSCLNVVTEPDGRPAALLVRSIRPLVGVDAMRRARLTHELARRRSTRGIDPAADAARTAAARLAAVRPERLASGPGLLAAAFDIERTATGFDLCDPGSPLRLETAPADEPPPTIVATPRIGIAYAGEPWVGRPWRFLVAGDPAVSGPAPR